MLHDLCKTEIYELWKERAIAWDKWSDALGAMADNFNQPLIEMAGIHPGDYVLDLASGAGEPALSIARLVGQSGQVVATDWVAEMLEGAKRRVQQEGLTNVRFEVADMENLPFPTGNFDHVTCRFGIMFCEHLGVALREARRVLKSKGRATYMVWGPLKDNTIFQVIREAMKAILPSESSEYDLLPFTLSEKGHLASALQLAGFKEIQVGDLRFNPQIKRQIKFWESHLEMSFGDRLSQASAAQRSALEQAILQRLEPYRVEEESYQLSVHIWIVSGSA